jgi:VanZ family protein
VLTHILHHRRLWRNTTLAYGSLLAFLSLNPWTTPPELVPPEVLAPDKLAHGLAYAGLAASAALMFWQRLILKTRRPAIFLGVWGGVTAYGILIEFLQHILPVRRSGEWEDALANGIGAALGLALVIFVLSLQSREATPSSGDSADGDGGDFASRG